MIKSPHVQGFAISLCYNKGNSFFYDYKKETWKSPLLHSFIEYSFTFYNYENSSQIIKMCKHHLESTFLIFYS